MGVCIGQVWRENDPRRAGRTFKVEDVAAGYAYCRAVTLSGGRAIVRQPPRFRTSVTNFHFDERPRKRGYALVAKEEKPPPVAVARKRRPLIGAISSEVAAGVQAWKDGVLYSRTRSARWKLGWRRARENACAAYQQLSLFAAESEAKEDEAERASA